MSLIFQWTQQLPSIFNPQTLSPRPVIAVDSTGNSYIAYVSVNPIFSNQGQTNVGLIDICVVKLDIDGNVVWYRQQPSFDTDQDDIDPSICVDSAGNVYVAYVAGGTTSGQTKTGLTDIVVFKLDSNGDTLWVRQSTDFNTTMSDLAPSIATDSAGNVYVAYYADDPSGPISYYAIVVLFKLDTDGTFLWAKKNSIVFNTSGGNYNPSLGVDGSGNCYVAYFCDGEPASGETSVGSYDIVVFKTDTDGNLLWIRQRPSFDTVSGDFNPSLAVSDSGMCHVAYFTNGTASGQTNMGGADIIVFKMDTNGDLLWIVQNPTFNTTMGDTFPSLDLDILGNVYVTYTTFGVASGQTATGHPDIVVFQLNSSGTNLQTIQQPSFNTLNRNVDPYIAVDGQGNCLVVYYSINLQGPSQNLVIFKLRNLVCVGGDTLIQLSDGSLRPIRSLHRGEIVAPNHTIAQVCQEPIDVHSPIDLMVFEPNCLGGGKPTQRLTITPNHPIFYKGARRPAKCFAQCPGVRSIQRQPTQSVLPLLDHEPYLYDLQFDHEGSYLANGLEIQSRSPYSYHGPLDQSMYDDPSMYCEDRVWDSMNQSLSLDSTPLQFNLLMLKNKCHVVDPQTTQTPTHCVITKYV